MLDNQNKPIKIAGKNVLIVVQLDEQGKYPKIDFQGEPMMYPQGIPLIKADGISIMLD